MDVTLVCSRCGREQTAENRFCPNCGAPLDPSMAKGPLPGKKLSNRYEIIEVIGEGGMGAVYKAKDTQLGDRLVAVKEMISNTSGSRKAGQAEAPNAPAQDLPPEVRQFQQEAFLLASLQHPHLPTIFDCFSETDETSKRQHWYLVMNFIEGETLKKRLDKATDHKLPLKETLRIALELCPILNYLHTRDIIFRDLKPSNIMITPEEKIYLIDFGIARHFKPERKKDTEPFASFGYASPEHYGFGQTNARSDIYSLGATLHHMLSGQDPEKKNPQHSPLQELDPTLPAPLVQLVTKMLENDPAQRPGTIAEVEQQLAEINAALRAPSVAREKAPGPHAPDLQPTAPAPSRVLTTSFLSLAFVIIGIVFCQAFLYGFPNFASADSGVISTDTGYFIIGAPLVIGGLALILVQNLRRRDIIGGSILLITGWFFLLILCGNAGSGLVNTSSDFAQAGVIGFFTCILTIGLGCFLFSRQAKVRGGLISGILLMLAGASIFGSGQGATLYDQPNSFGIASLLILFVLGLLLIVLPIQARATQKKEKVALA